MILFDEPLSNLDLKLRVQTRSEIKRVQQLLGMTVLYVTHDQSEALSLSDKILVMDHGKVVQTGSPEEIHSNPANAFIADFIGNANFLTALSKETEGDLVTVRLGKRLLVLKRNENSGKISEGDEVYLALKPDDIEISEKETDFRGVIELKLFLGSHTEYRIEFEGSLINDIRHNKGRPSSYYKAGDRVYLMFDMDRILIYSAGE